MPLPPIKSGNVPEFILDRPEKLLLEMRICLHSCSARGVAGRWWLTSQPVTLAGCLWPLTGGLSTLVGCVRT